MACAVVCIALPQIIRDWRFPKRSSCTPLADIKLARLGLPELQRITALLDGYAVFAACAAAAAEGGSE
jgi:hypothetical protein